MLFGTVPGVPSSSQTSLWTLFRFQREECIAKDLEQSGLALPASVPESVNSRTYIDLDEPAFFQQTPPACARQATGNSVGPQIDVADGRFRHNLAGGDVGELQPSTGAQHSHNLIEDTTLVGAEVNDAVADDDIGPTVLDRRFLGTRRGRSPSRSICAAATKQSKPPPDPRSTTCSPGFNAPCENGLPTPANASMAVSGIRAITSSS